MRHHRPRSAGSLASIPRSIRLNIDPGQLRSADMRQIPVLHGDRRASISERAWCEFHGHRWSAAPVTSRSRDLRQRRSSHSTIGGRSRHVRFRSASRKSFGPTDRLDSGDGITDVWSSLPGIAVCSRLHADPGAGPGGRRACCRAWSPLFGMLGFSYFRRRRLTA